MKELIFITLGIILYSSYLGYSQDLPPVAVNDSIIVYTNGIFADTIHEYPVTLNDYDPQGKAFRIKEVRRQGYEQEEVLFNDSIIFMYNDGNFDLIEKVFFYRIQQIEDTTLVSNWARLYTNPSGGPDWPVARADTVFIIRWHTADLNLLDNDFHPLGDTSRIGYFSGGGNVLTDSLVRINGYSISYESSYDWIYCLTDTTNWYDRYDVGLVHVQLSNNHFYDSLDLNNINARFYCFGHHFWDFDNRSYFTVPNGSNIPSLFNQALWIGGLDEQGQLHVAGERYRDYGKDYGHGPVSETYDSLYDLRWYHVWNLKREDIEYHKMNWEAPGYEPIDDILTWPANGDTELGQASTIAPFEDLNGNGLYEPLLGDAPSIKGDQALYFVFNDARFPHEESGGIPLGVEIRGMAYAFDAPEDSVLWNTIFLHYDIVNRSDTSYNNVYLGLHTDTQLGYAWNDYIESDVENGMYFTYNGEEYDPNTTGYYNGYGYHPPAQGIMMLAGPYLEPDGLDNPRFDVLGNQILNESINGMNFGDEKIDNERLGMRSFVYYHGSGFGNPPYEAQHFYNYLQGYWFDGSSIFYGGFGHPLSGAVGPECRYWCPRDSDPYNWGTYGLFPNPPFNPDNLFWSEEQSGNNPNYRRGISTMGPFTLEPGQSQPLDVAYPWARAYGGTAWESALLLKERAAYIRELFETDSAFVSGIQNRNTVVRNELVISPNPATTSIRIDGIPGNIANRYKVYNQYGRVVKHGMYQPTSGELALNINDLPKGFYIMILTSESQVYLGRFVKI